MKKTGDLEILPSRRQVLLMGATGLITLVGFGSKLAGEVFAESSMSHGSTPALEEGPYWVDETGKAFHRSDLRANVDGTNVQKGLPLHLSLKVSQVTKGGFSPMPHAFVYLWCANALGDYSDEDQLDSANDTYLRGYQVTDGEGQAQYLMIYPGWYGGRTVHIHARVRTYPNQDPTRKPLHDFETQFFFDDAITDQVFSKVSPYNQREGRDTVNNTDHVYTGSSLDGTHGQNSGALTKVQMAEDTSHATASFHMILDLSKHAQVGGGFGGPPPGGYGGQLPYIYNDGPPPGVMD